MSFWKNLIEQFLIQNITVEEFVRDFLDMRRKQIIGNKLPPEGNTALDELRTSWLKNRISQAVYLKRAEEIFERYLGKSTQSNGLILEKLFYEIDAYYDNSESEYFDPKFDITEDQLREAAKEALDELNKLP